MPKIITEDMIEQAAILNKFCQKATIGKSF